MQKCECVVMEFGYKFCGISAASKYVCVGEWRLAEWHLVHMRNKPYFLWHLWMWTPHATSKESLLARYGALEYA